MRAPHTPQLNEDGTPRRKYELDADGGGKTGLRIAIGIALASAVAVVKNVLFPGGGNTVVGSRSAAEGEAQSKLPRDEAAAIADVALSEGREGTEEATGLVASSATDGSSAFRLVAGPAQIGARDSVRFATPLKLSASTNDNEALYGAAPGRPIILGPAASAGRTEQAGGSSSSPGNRGDDPIDAGAVEGDADSDEDGPQVGDTTDGDHDETDPDGNQTTPRPMNRLPVSTAPVVLGTLVSNQALVITMSDLLRNTTDADGDTLQVRDLAATSGRLVAIADGHWRFTPDYDDTADVRFTYSVADAADQVAQWAFVDLAAEPMSILQGTSGDDRMVGTPRADDMDAGGGNDVILALEGDDVVIGGDGDDRIVSGEGDDVVLAGDGNDIAFAGNGDDIVVGGDGNDALFGEDGDDYLVGGGGDDTLDGGDGSDVLDGGEGADYLTGHGGNDLLIAGEGGDVVDGGDGDDVIIAGAGADRVDGGSGADRFVAAAGDGNDSVEGGDGADTLDLSGTTAAAVIDLSSGTAESGDIGEDRISGVENVVAGSGNDTIVANEAVNFLSGGDGEDHFVFHSAAAIGRGIATRDRLMDFEIGDRIDLDDISREFADIVDDTFESQDIRRFVLIDEQREFDRPGQLQLRFETLDESEITIVAEPATTQNSTTYMHSTPVTTVPTVAPLYIQRSMREGREDRNSHSPLGNTSHALIAATAVTAIAASRVAVIDAAICQMLA